MDSLSLLIVLKTLRYMTIIFMLIKDDHHPLTCFLYSSSASAEEAGRSLGTVGNSQHEKWCSNLAAYFAHYALSLACRETRRENVLGFAFDLLLLLPFLWCSAYLSGPGCVCWWHRRTIFFFSSALGDLPFYLPKYMCVNTSKKSITQSTKQLAVSF